jgi:hypothetical protein
VALTDWQIKEHDIATVEKDGRRVQEAEALPTDGKGCASEGLSWREVTRGGE